MNRRTKFLIRGAVWTLAIASGLFGLAARSIGASQEESGKAGSAGESTRRDVVSLEALAQSGRDVEVVPVRVQRKGGRWIRTSARVGVPPGAIDTSGAVLRAADESEPMFSLAGGAPPSPAAGASFGGVLDDGTRFNPDTQGAVGPNHLMVTLSSQVRVQDRSGNTLTSVTLNQFWSGLGTYQVFDPRVLFDPFSQRWIHTAIANPGETNAGLLIAVSQTANPTGNWFRHFIGVGVTNRIFPDSPNVGFTKDWITVQANMFDNTNFDFFSSDIWAFNKTNLYNGATASFRHFRYASDGLGAVNALVPAVNYDNTSGTNYLVATWVGDYADPVAGPIGLLRLFSISGPVNAPVFNDYGPGGLFIFGSAGLYNPPWADFDPLDQNFAPQLGTTNKIFIGDSRIQNVVFRNSTLWCAHHVFLPYNNPTRSSIQWFGFTAGGTVLQRGRVDDSSGAKFFGYPSIAVNQNEDVLLGYTRFAANQYPSANYSFHGFEDFPGTLRGDTVLKAGEAPFAASTGGTISWGDWSATVVDPNDIDFWTLQEYASARVGGSDRWGTWWGVVSPPTSLTITMTGSPNPVLATANATYSIRVTNNYAAPATGVRMIDVLPAGAVFVSAVSSLGACSQSAGVVTCDVGTLAPNASMTATIVARLNESGTATNRATVAALGPDDAPLDNTAIVLTTVNPSSDVSITMSGSPDPVPLNTTLTYQIGVSNAGPSPAPGVYLTNTLPSGVTFISATAGQGSCSRSGSIVICTLGTILSGASVPVTIRVTPTVSSVLTNSAIVVSSSVDPSLSNNSASVATRANATPTISAISNRTIPEDNSTGPIAFTVGDVETPAGSLTLTGLSSAPEIVPVANIVYGGSGASRTVTVTPAQDASGVVTITTYVTDGDGARATNSFVLTVTPVNDPPAISDVLNQTIDEDTVLGPLTFSIFDVETPASSLSVSVTSSNPGLIPGANIVLGGAGSIRTVTLWPTTNQFGTATISILVGDGAITTTRSFLLTVNLVNDLPTITSLPNRTIDEDTSTGAMAFTIGDVETPVASLTLSGASSNPTIVPTSGIVFGGSGANRTVTVTPAPDQFGTVTITVTVTDGNNGSSSTAFQLVINDVNDPPTLGAISSIAVNEDSGTNSITLTVIGSGAPNENQTLVVTATSSNPSVIPNPLVEYTSPATTGTLRFAPLPDANGSAQITVTINDGGASNNVFSRTFTVTVLPVNDASTVTAVADRTIDEDTSTGPIAITVNDIDSPLSAVTLSAGSTNLVLVPLSNIIFGGSGSNRTVEIRPATNQFGMTRITLIVSDGQASSSNTFLLTVRPVNDPPTISQIANVTTLEDQATNVVVTVGDVESPLAALQLTAVSSNPVLIPSGNITFAGTGASRTAFLNPSTNASGAATVTVIVTDGEGLSTSNSFVFTVLPVNDPPTLNAIGNLTIAEDAGTQTVTLGGITSGAPDEQQVLTVTASSSNPSLIPNPTVSYLSPNVSGSLTFAPVADASGTAVITVTVNDGGTVNNLFSRSFTVTVTPVNDLPTISVVASVTMLEDGATNVIVTVADVETPAASLTLQAGSSNEELIDATGILLSGAGGSRVLALRPLPNQFGSATIFLMVSDGEGGSATAFINLTVLPVNDAPTISPLSDVTIRQDTSTPIIPFTVVDEETFVDNLTIRARSSNSTLVPAGGIVLGGSGFNRTIRVTPAPGQFGTAVITIEAVDEEAATNSVSFLLTVRVVNTPPTLNPIADVTIPEDAPLQTVALTGISSGSVSENQTLTVTATSSNPTLIPTPVILYTSPQSTGGLNFRPSPDAFGNAVITVTVDDGMPEDNLVTRTFSVTVTPVNDAPTILPIADLSTDKNRPTAPVSITVGDLETPAAGLVLTAVSSNTGLVANATIVITGTNLVRSMTVTPKTNEVGVTFITVSVTDAEGLSASQTFRLTVYPVDYPPTISPIANVSMPEDGSTVVGFTIGDEETPVGLLGVMASSSNTALIPPAGLTLGGAGANRTLSIRPAPDRSGTSVVTVTVTDLNGTPTNRAFTVTVNEVNDLPTISGLGTVSIDRGTSSGPLLLVVDDVETPAASLVVTAVSQNVAIIPNSGLVLGGSGAVRTLVVTPAANQSGTVTVAVTVTDGNGAGVTSNLVVIVNAVNSLPTLNPLGNLVIDEDAGSQTVNLSGITAGAGETQPLVVSAVSSNPGLIPNPTVSYVSPATTGSLQFVPRANASGVATLTVTVSDGQGVNGSVTRSFTVTVNPVNDAPTISTIAAQQTNEDVPLVVVFVVDDAETPVDMLILSGTSTNTSLVANTNILFSGSGTNRTLTVVPTLNQFGTTLITVQVGDGTLSSSSSFVLTVLSVNDSPTLDPIPNFVTNSAGANPSYIINLSGITAGAPNEIQTLTVTATSSNPSFLPDPVATYTSPNTTGSIRLRPANNATGSAVVTVTVSDNGGGSNTFRRSFLVNVKASANVLPTISAIAAQVINEDGSTGPIPFAVRDAETAASLLTLSGTSSNPSLIPDGNIVFGGSGTNRTVTVTPLPDQFGTSAITLTVVDGAFGASNLTFSVTVNAVNDVPAISAVANQTVLKNGVLGPLAVIVGDVETLPGSLSLTATSSDTALIPNANLRIGGVGAGRSITVTPATNMTGTATIRLVVSDGLASATNQFTVTVTPVNNPPTISDIVDQVTQEDVAIAPIPFTVGDVETAAGALVVTSISSNPALVPLSGIILGGSGAARTVAINPATNQIGTTIITVTVDDGAATASDSFLVTVTSVNDPPTLAAIGDVSLNSTDGPQTVALSGISAGPSNESQPLIVAASSSNPSVVPHPVVVYSSPGSTGSLSFTPRADAGGSAVITVTVNDGQALNNTAVRTFTVTINQAPTISTVANQVMTEDVASGPIPVTIGDLESAPVLLVVSAASSDPSVIAPTGLALSGTGATRQLVLTPVADAFGATTVTLSVEDPAGNRTTTTFLVTVRAVNDRPTLDAIADVTVPVTPNAKVVNLTGIGPGATNEIQVLTVRAASSNPAIIPHPVVSYASPASTGSLTFTPSGTATGLVVISVTVQDDSFDDGSDSNRVTRTFVVDVTGGAAGPMLTIELVGGKAVVSWATNNGAGFVLQSTTAMGDGAAWFADGTVPLIINGRHTVTNSIGGRARFFRLCDGCASPPALSIRLEGGEVVVSWPVAGSLGYVLQEAADVSNSGSWTNVAGAPTVVAGFNTIRASSSGAPRFYRLCNGCGN